MNNKTILFCLPYAGGSEIVFYKWNKLIDPKIEIYPIELKGRSKRYDEEFYGSVAEAVEDIYEQIKDKIKYNQYAIYGHSMGSLLGYELYNKINEKGNKLPIHMFFSGRQAPCVPRKKKCTYNLPDEQFISSVAELGGMPKEVLESKELMEFILPILRNDFKILDLYKRESIHKIQCDISVLNGDEDDIDQEDILAWKNHAMGECRIYNFKGDHFFINNHLEEIISIINSTIKQVCISM